MPVNPEDMIQLLMKTNADQEERLKEKDQTISDLRATVEELRNTVTDLRSTIANLNETLDEFKRKLFGTSSEKVKQERPVELSATVCFSWNAAVRNFLQRNGSRNARKRNRKYGVNS